MSQGQVSADAVGSVVSDVRFVHETGLANRIATLVEPTLIELGFRLVRVTVTGRDGDTVQIMVERPDGSIAVEDCVAITRQVSPLMDVHDVVQGRYRLEISSPGIDRPLVRPSDFVDWKGHLARIEVKVAIDGRKRFRGTVAGFERGEALLEAELPGQGTQTLGFAIELIEEAKLLMTDDLIREALRRAKGKGSRTDVDAPSAEPVAAVPGAPQRARRPARANECDANSEKGR